MGLVTDVRFAHEDGALVETLRALPELPVELVGETSTAPGRNGYVFRFETTDAEEIRSALERDRTVRGYRPVPGADGCRLWRIEFSPDTTLLGPAVTRAGGVVLKARSSPASQTPRGWHERWFFDDHERINRVWEYARSAGFEFDIRAFSRQRVGDTSLETDPLTDHQRTALVAAYEQGYFEEPRAITLETLAASLGLSPSAVAGRLKRGMKALLESSGVETPSVRSQAADVVDPRYRTGSRAPASRFRRADRPPNAPTGASSSTVSARVYVTHPDLALTATIRACPDAEISVVSDAGTDPEHDRYLFRIVADDFGPIEEALTADDTVADFSVVLEQPGRRTYRLEYDDDATLLTPHVVDQRGLVRSTESYLRGWMLHLQLRDHETLCELDERARAEGIRFEILELTRVDDASAESSAGPTDAQAEALLVAYERGYYDEPRNASLEEVATRLDLSPTAASGRLRRGSASLVAALVDDVGQPARARR